MSYMVLVSVVHFYEWKTTGWNCPSCQAMAGCIIEEGFEPASHPHCDCYLSLADTVETWEEVSDFEPGLWRLMQLTGIDGKKFISSDGLGPKLEDIQADSPKPNTYSRDQIDLYL